MIRVTMQRNYDRMSFVFKNMKEASEFIEVAMDSAEEELDFSIEKVEPKESIGSKTFEDMLAEDEE